MSRGNTLRRPAWIFDVEDHYARDRGVRGAHPRPLGPIRFRLLEEAAGGRLFDPPLDLEVRKNPSGYHLFFGQTRPSHRKPRGTLLAEGTYRVRVEGEHYQAAERRDVALPGSAEPIFFDLDPGFRYPFPRESTLGAGRGPTLLRGGLHRADGSGVAGATVSAEEASYPYTTDDDGQWVLVFPDRLFANPGSTVNVGVRFVDGGETRTLEGVPLGAGLENSLAQTALRGWVTGENGVPLAGAEIEVSALGASARDPSRSGRDGGWFHYFPIDQADVEVEVTAIHPDGRRQTRSAVPVRARSTIVVPTFHFINR